MTWKKQKRLRLQINASARFFVIFQEDKIKTWPEKPDYVSHIDIREISDVQSGGMFVLAVSASSVACCI